MEIDTEIVLLTTVMDRTLNCVVGKLNPSMQIFDRSARVSAGVRGQGRILKVCFDFGSLVVRMKSAVSLLPQFQDLGELMNAMRYSSGAVATVASIFSLVGVMPPSRTVPAHRLAFA